MGPIPEILQYTISILLAFLVSFFSTPLVKNLAIKANVFDVPDDARRIHKRPIAKLGGLAIISGFFVTILINAILYAFDIVTLMMPSNQLIGFLSGLFIIIIMGTIDDLYGLNAKWKFLFQIVAALIVIFSGTRIPTLTNPFSTLGFITLPGWVSFIFTLLWIVGITNAINFIDGLDGLAAGVTTIATFSLFIVSLLSGDERLLSVSLITAILGGSTLGFLPYNLNPAKIFMSDIGSNFLGFSLAVITIQGTMKSYAAIALAVPIVILAIPLFDVIFAIIRRIVHKKKITDADRGHLHHRLIDLGLPQKKVVFILHSISMLLGFSAIILSLISKKHAARIDAIYAFLFIFAIFVFITIFIRVLKSLTNAKNNSYDNCETENNPISLNTDEQNDNSSNTTHTNE